MKTFIPLAAASVVTAMPAAHHPVTLPVKYVTNVQSPKALVDSGKARAAAMSGNASSASGTIDNEVGTYVATVNIGGKAWELIVDTGSSNLWCGARQACEPTKSGVATGGSWQIEYGSGAASGLEYNDTVTFAGLTVKKQTLGAATSSQGFSTVDGILGLGPVALTQNTVSNMNLVPTFLDNLYSQGLISTELLGVSFAPPSGSNTNTLNGELTLGATDPTRYSGSLTYFPKLSSGTLAPYWGLNVAAFKYGAKTLGTNAQCVIDTGTTLIYIPQAALNAFMTASGGTIDPSTGLVSYTKAPTKLFKVDFGSTTYRLKPSQYLIPQAEYALFGLTQGTYYTWINAISASNINCIIGQKFMENFYAAFDTTNARIGFATSAVRNT